MCLTGFASLVTPFSPAYSCLLRFWTNNFCRFTETHSDSTYYLFLSFRILTSLKQNVVQTEKRKKERKKERINERKNERMNERKKETNKQTNKETNKQRNKNLPDSSHFSNLLP